MTTPDPVVGMVLRRSSHQLAAEPFYGDLIAGLESGLQPHGYDVLVRMVPSMEEELEAYRLWSARRLVSACILTDVVPEDPRPGELARLGLRGIVFGEPTAGVRLPAVRPDGYAEMTSLVGILADLGHTRIAHVGGRSELVHTQVRASAFHDATRARGLDALRTSGDYSAESGDVATRQLLGGPDRDVRPTAIIYDNDVMAVAGLLAAARFELSVPDDLTIVAWDDSSLCRLATPPLSALNHDVRGSGEAAAALLLDVLAGKEPGDVVTAAAVWVPRGSSADPRRTVPSPAEAKGL